MDEHFDPSNTAIKISDASSLLRKQIDPNERPFTKTVLKANNSLVDEWHETVLKNICDTKGCIRAGQMWYEWQYFYFGKTLSQFVEHLEKGLVVRPDKKAVDFWVKTFTEGTVKTLSNMGSPLVGYGWKVVVDEAFIRSSLDKWDKIYSKSQDPLVWRKLANNFPKLWSATNENPFWSTEEFDQVTQKVMTVLRTPISPEK